LLLIRLRLSSYLLYVGAMLFVVFASYVAIFAGQDWSLAFLVPFAAIPGGVAFRRFAYLAPSNAPPGWTDALLALLWTITTFLAFDGLLATLQGHHFSSFRQAQLGVPWMTLCGAIAMFACAWSRRLASALSWIGLLIAAACIAGSVPSFTR
jgi:hypothetical protein